MIKSFFSNRSLLFLCFFLLSLSVKANPDLELIRQKIADAYMEPTVNDARIGKLIDSINDNGSWPGINYSDVSRTGFQHSQHLLNMVELCRAYVKNGSAFKGNEHLKDVIDSSLGFWTSNDFICDNWWWNQIGTPDQMIKILLILDKDLSEDQVKKILPIVGRANLNASGARPSGDRIKIAGILAKVCLFSRDTVQFDEVIKVIAGEIKFSTERGMQYDYSFHHRVDRVNNTLSYGTGYADAFAEWAALVSGTVYQFPDESIHTLTDYYLDGICKMMVYGKFPDPGAKNRSISRSGALNPMGISTPLRLLLATDYRKNELEEIIRIRNGEAKATLSFSSFFWQSEHYTQQRPSYFSSVRMYSTRNCNMEQPYNGEGLLNHHKGDGANFISRTGKEYDDLAPVYDFQKIPGTTVVQKNVLPSENKIQKKGITDFVGAVTDGLYGAVAFDYKSPHDPLTARKAWFFFDEEYVCLGAGISSESSFPVATTVNQCLLHNEVVVMSNNKISEIPNGQKEIGNVNWVWHDSIAYLFPKPATLNISNKNELGSWYRINHQSDSPKDEVSEEIFKMWLDHGPKPKMAAYQYIVIPSVSRQEMTDIENSRGIEILENNYNVQAVKNSRLNISQIVFYDAGDIMLSPGMNIVSESAGIVMIKTDGNRILSVSVSDPSRSLRKIQLSITAKLLGKGDNYSLSWDNSSGLTHLSIELPQDVYAGKSVSIDF